MRCEPNQATEVKWLLENRDTPLDQLAGWMVVCQNRRGCNFGVTRPSGFPASFHFLTAVPEIGLFPFISNL